MIAVRSSMKRSEEHTSELQSPAMISYAVFCLKRFGEKSLPPKEAFYSKLTGEGITDEYYQHAHTVWKEFNIESIKDYHKLYNLSDVLLLADISKTLGVFA